MLGVDRSSSYSSTCSDPAVRRIVRSVGKQPEIQHVPRTRVTFAQEVATVVGYVKNRRDLTDEERNGLYIEPEKNLEIRKHAKLTAKYYRLKDTKAIEELDGYYLKIQALAAEIDSGQRSESEEEEELLALGVMFKSWCQRHKFCGRGLERYCSGRQREERARFIVDTQRILSCMASEPSVSSERLSNFYRKHTLQARLLARAFGKADAAAVSRSNYEQTPSK